MIPNEEEQRELVTMNEPLLESLLLTSESSYNFLTYSHTHISVFHDVCTTHFLPIDRSRVPRDADNLKFTDST